MKSADKMFAKQRVGAMTRFGRERLSTLDAAKRDWKLPLVSLFADLYVSGINDTRNVGMLDRDIVALSPSIDAEGVAAVAKALAHPARVRIIAFLLSKPGCIGGDIVDQVGLAQSTVSEHLRILKDAGLVQGTIEYPRICYSLDPSALVPLRALIEAIATRVPEGEAACCYIPQDRNPKETTR